LSESKKYLNSKSLPKKPAKILKATLEKLFERLVRPQLSQLNGQAYAQQSLDSNQTSPSNKLSPDAIKKNEQLISIEIQEAFVKFMSSILKGFRSFLRPITRAPTVGATDPWSLFDAVAFLSSRDRTYVRFYELLLETQMFAHFVEQRSFMSDRETCLAFFDECLDLIEKNPDFESSPDARLIDLDDYHRDARTVFIPAPENDEGDDTVYIYHKFGPLDESKYHAHPPDEPTVSSSLQSSRDNVSTDNRSVLKNPTQSPLSRRTKQEIRIAQRVARRHAEAPLSWAKCLVSYVYSLWFIQLPAFCKKVTGSDASVAYSNSKSNPIRLALEVLQRMQSLNLHPMDETCYRVLMRLCGESGQPALAVKVLFEMKRHGVIPNAITYGYYNNAVLESSWPSGDSTATLLWSKLRNVVFGVNAFKQHARHRRAKRALNFSTEDDGVFENPHPTLRHSKESTGQEESTLEPEEKTPKISTSNTDTDENALEVEITSIVKSTPSSSGLPDSASEVQTRKSDPVPCPKKKTNRSSLDCDVSASFDSADQTGSHKHHYMRSFSFGNDSKIIQNLKEGPLKALKHELERNHQMVLEEETEQKDSSGFISQTSDAPSHDTVEDNYHPSIKPKSLTLPENTSPPSSKSTPLKTNRSSSLDGWLKGHTSRFTGKASLAGSMSPLKDAFEGLSLFSADGKVANSIRSGIKYASRITDSPRKTIPRSSTFDGADQLPKPPSLVPKPSVFHVLGKQADAEAEAHAKSTVSDSNDQVLTSTPNSKDRPPVTGWSIGKQSDWNTTFKSAANSMASRFSEIKSNLSANSPAKFTGALSQFANMVADKLPANFTTDEEDSTSNFSFDNRRLSVAYSDDEGSELSREGSIARYRGGPPVATAIFETMEKHFKEQLEEKSKNIVLEIEIASCSRCYNCSILVFDEEIMEGWSADDSNLNTNCVHCLSKFVPLLTITVSDGSEAEDDDDEASNPFTVPYLSPLVLRKEVENVLENEGDYSLLHSSFIEDHPIIYWNLVWYFERTNLPSHLPGLAMSLFPSLKVNSILHCFQESN
jgi:pentatricopeptide repeat protein